MRRRQKNFTTEQATSLMNAFDVILTWAKSSKVDSETLWFRGVKDCEFHLEPGAYWRPSYRESLPLLDLVQEGRAFENVGELEEWSTYYLAQHVGIPTRLLDWTESFTSALFFALDGWDGITIPCVWVLRPERVNELSTEWKGLITPEQNEELKLWLPKSIEKGPRKIVTEDGKWTYDNRFPIAIYPRKQNRRMIAQQGTFTVHGTEKLRLEEWIANAAKDPKSMLLKVVLKGLKKDSTLSQLNALGVRRHMMYPDLAHYVEYLKEAYRW